MAGLGTENTNAGPADIPSDRVTGDDIKAVVDGTPGPLVDGTAYHSEEFAEHQQHSRDARNRGVW